MTRAALLLAAFVMVPGPAPAQSPAPFTRLFDCSDETRSVELFGTAAGKLALTIRKLDGSRSVASAWSEWDDIRTGYVTGQQGGHQGHLRLFDGVRQIILFEGEDGALADRPGRTYAGVLTETTSNPAQDIRVACAAEPLNGALLANLAAWTERLALPAVADEDQGSPYDGWF